MTLILFAIATIGLTNVIVHGKIMELLGIKPFLKRHLSNDWYSLFECYECTGFWAGLICGSLIVVTLHDWYLVLACGWAGSVLAQTYADAIFWLRSKVEFELPEEENAGPSATEKPA